MWIDRSPSFYAANFFFIYYIPYLEKSKLNRLNMKTPFFHVAFSNTCDFFSSLKCDGNHPILLIFQLNSLTRHNVLRNPSGDLCIKYLIFQKYDRSWNFYHRVSKKICHSYDSFLKNLNYLKNKKSVLKNCTKIQSILLQEFIFFFRFW